MNLRALHALHEGVLHGCLRLTGSRFDHEIGAAGDPSTSPELLSRLAAHSAAAVRMAVAANPSCPAGALTDLAFDRVAAVRRCVASNGAAAPEVRSVAGLA